MEETKVETLRSNEYLAALEEDELRALIEVTNQRTLVSGEPVWSVGETGDAGYALVSGRIELTWRAQPDGKQKRQIGEAGALFGLAHLVEEWTHESTAYPVERTEVLEIPRDDFLELFDAHAPSAYRLLDAVADRLVEEMRDANRRLQDVFGQPAETLRTLRRRARDTGRR